MMFEQYTLIVMLCVGMLTTPFGLQNRVGSTMRKIVNNLTISRTIRSLR